MKFFPLKFAFACLYRTGYLLLRKTIYRPKEALKSPVIILGSFLAGGAGKTPLTIELAKRFSAEGLRVAILCHSAAWDECKLIAKKVPAVSLFKTQNRYAVAQKIDGKFDVILSDGGLEDSRFVGANIFILRWNECAKKISDLIPAGKCVSLEKDHPLGKKDHPLGKLTKQIICSEKNSAAEKSKITEDECVQFFIEKIQNAKGESLPQNAECAVVVGIGNPERFVRDVKNFGARVSHFRFLPDHAKNYEANILQEISRGQIIVITEKDFVRLRPEIQKSPLLYIAEERVKIGTKIFSYLNAAAGGAAKNPPSTL